MAHPLGVRIAAATAYISRAHDRACWEYYLGPVPDTRHLPEGRQTARDSGRLRQRFELQHQEPELWAQETDWNPIWSFDHPTIHGGETGAPVLEALGLSEAEHFPLTHNSPDLHRVVERTHARLCRRFDRWFLLQRQEHPMSRYKEELMQSPCKALSCTMSLTSPDGTGTVVNPRAVSQQQLCRHSCAPSKQGMLSRRPAGSNLDNVGGREEECS